MPGKVQICAWRACQYLLPTRDRLMSKGYTGDISCMLCEHSVEDTKLLFGGCPTASEFFSKMNFDYQSSLLPEMSFKEWMLEKAMQLSQANFEGVLMEIWSIVQNL